jgi:group II intron reverse transcriptase/maturase/CRISPR-associated endonuclease Cas1
MPEFENIFSYANLLTAWDNIKQKNKAGGIDNISISAFQNEISLNINNLQKELLENNYIPEPYKRIFIEKNETELRPIGLLTIRDKLVQQCILNYYRFKIEKQFTDTSYAYRINKSHTKAINRIQDFINRGCRWVCPIDIDNFFDNINRQKLINKCRNIFSNERILKLIEMWIKTGIIQRGKYVQSDKGIAQGGVISPVLSNIYLDEYDKAMLSNKYFNVRYADNILLISKDQQFLLESLKFTREFLQNNLDLSLNKIENDSVSISQPFTFCGIQFDQGKKLIDPSKYRKLITTFQSLLDKESLSVSLIKINEHLDGIRRYYVPFDAIEQIKLLNDNFVSMISKKLFKELDQKITGNLTDAKKILMQINLLTDENTGSKETLVNKILSRIKEEKQEREQKPVVKSEAEKAVDKKRKIYQKIWYNNLDIHISSINSHIGKSGYKIIVRREGKTKNEISADKIQNVLISAGGVTISSDAVKLCVEKEIRINYFDTIGRPYASVIPAISPLLSLTNFQFEALNNVKGKVIIKELVSTKIKNQLSLIKYFTKNKKITKETAATLLIEAERMNEYVIEIKNLSLDLNIDEIRGKTFGFEGLSASSYWQMLKMIIPADYGFEKREHQNAFDVVNMMLNYAYGILYTRILNAVTISGLNPNISFLHKEQTNKPTLIFDLIEQFRAPVADKAVVAILTKNSKVTKTKNLLSDDTRNKVAKKVLTKLNTEIYYKGKSISFNDIIFSVVKNLVSYLKSEEKKFKPFLSKW